MSDGMTLLNLTNFPPGGWKYREVSLAWSNPDPLNGEGLDHAVKLLQMVRVQNRDAHPNLDPSYAACRQAIVDFTCARLKYDPRWCGLPPAEVQRRAESLPRGVGKKRKCAGCGRR